MSESMKNDLPDRGEKTGKPKEKERGTPKDVVDFGHEKEPHPKAYGVLRLIQSGHFKGVADLRLRINFHEQLSAIQEGQRLEAVDSLEDRLILSLQEVWNREEFSSLFSGITEENIQSIYEELESSIAVAFENYRNTADTDSLLIDLTSGLEHFQNQLQNFFQQLAEKSTAVDFESSADALEDNSEVPSNDAEEVKAGDRAEEPDQPSPGSSENLTEADFSEKRPLHEIFLETLDMSLQGEVDSIRAFLQGLQYHPEPASSNPGRAYEKFLAQYQDLTSPPRNDEADQESVDEIV
jgi:hypothetical protein